MGVRWIAASILLLFLSTLFSPIAAPSDTLSRVTPPATPAHYKRTVLSDFSAMQRENIVVRADGAAELAAGPGLVGTETVTVTSSEHSEWICSVLTDSQRNCIVVWFDPRSGGWLDLYARRYGTDRSPIGEEVLIAGDVYSGMACRGANDAVLMVWADADGISGRLYASDLSPAGDENQIVNGSEQRSIMGVSATSRGGYILVWYDTDVGDIFAYRLDATGKAAGPCIDVCVAPGISYPSGSIAIARNDDFMIAWTDAREWKQNATDVRARLFNGPGDTIGKEIMVCDGPAQQSSPVAVADENGSYLVLWNAYEGGYLAVHGARFDGSGESLGPAFRLIDGPFDDFIEDAKVDSEGRAVLAFCRNYGKNSYDILVCMMDRGGNRTGFETTVRRAINAPEVRLSVDLSDDIVCGWSEWDVPSQRDYIKFQKVCHRRVQSGAITTGPVAPDHLWKWDRLLVGCGPPNASASNISLEFSPGGVGWWLEVPQNGSLAGAGAAPSVLFRATLRSDDNITTPRLFNLTLIYYANAPPAISLPRDFSIWRNEPVELAVNATDIEGDRVTLSWAQTSGPPVIQEGWSRPSLSFTPASSGTYSFSVTASDGYNRSLPAGINITVGNRAPSATLPPELSVRKNARFELAANASDPDNDPVELRWTQTAGPHGYITYLTGPVLAFAAGWAGSYVFKVIASDGEASSEPAYMNLTVWGLPPEARLAVSCSTALPGEAVLFDASDSFDPDGRIVSYEFDFGDGASSGPGPDPRSSHVYGSAGNYTVEVRARDDDGNESGSPPAAVEIVPRPTPRIAITSPADSETVASPDVTVTLSVEGMDLAAATDHIHLRLDNGTPVTRYRTEPYTFTGVPDGSHTILAYLEDGAHRRHSNPEATAEVQFTVKVPKLPNISTTGPGLSMAPAHPVEGDLVRFSAGVRNLGGPAREAFAVSIYLDGDLKDSVRVPGLAEGGVFDLNWTWEARAGRHTVRVVADAGDSTAESDETDNTAGLEFSVAGKAGPASGPGMAQWAMGAAAIGVALAAAALAARRLRRPRP